MTKIIFYSKVTIAWLLKSKWLDHTKRAALTRMWFLEHCLGTQEEVQVQRSKTPFSISIPQDTAVTTCKYSKSPKVPQNRIKCYYLLYCRFTSTAPINPKEMLFQVFNIQHLKTTFEFSKMDLLSICKTDYHFKSKVKLHLWRKIQLFEVILV